MPSIVAVVSKRTIRRDVARITDGYHTRTTTSGGSSTTAVIAGLTGIGQEYVTVKEPWWVCNDQENAGEYRRAVTFATATVTFGDAFSFTIDTAVSMDSYPYPPNLYTEAVNLAAARIWKNCWRIVHGHLIPSDGDYYALPRNMRVATYIGQTGRQVVKDLADRADSATSPENNWSVVSGDTWGVSSEELYSVTDTNGDMMTQDVNLKDGFIQAILRGTMESSTVYRTPAVLFRVAEDYAGALDTNNYLLVRLLNDGSNDTVQLRKVDGGVESSLTTANVALTDGTNYEIKIEFAGTLIKVWVDDIWLISYNLTGGNLKYLRYPRMGLRLDKAGAPATAARIDSVYAYGMDYVTEWRDWQNNDDELSITLPLSGTRGPSGLLRVEGKQMLTALDSDTTAGALANDTTAVLEISTAEPAYRKLVAVSSAELRRLIGDPEWPKYMEDALALPGMRSRSGSIRGPM